MDLKQTEIMANALLKQHKLNDWRFGWDRSLSRFGACHYRRKLITLSKYLVDKNHFDDVYQTLLHEISHALAGYKAGHGPAWKAIARSIGCNAERCYSSKTVQTPVSRYKLVCSDPNCTVSIPRYRKTTTPYNCGQCSKKGIKSRLVLKVNTIS